MVNSKYSLQRFNPGLSKEIEEGFCPDAQHRQSSSSVFSSPRVRKLPSAFTEHNAPPSVIRLFTAWVEEADEVQSCPNGIITINRQSPGLLYSYTTVTKAIRWLVAHHLLKRVEVGRGRGNRSRYSVRWTFAYKTIKDRQKAANMQNRHFAPSIRSIRGKALKAKPPLESETDSKEKVYSLTRWIKDAPTDPPPSEREKRKLSAAVRLLIPSPRVADALLEGLWWRRKAPLRLWRDTIAALWQGVSIPEGVSDKELVWRVRQGLKNLLNTGNREAFKTELEAPPPFLSPTQETVEGKLKRVTARIKGIRAKYPEWKAQAVKTGTCPTCGKPVTQHEIEEGFHACARWWNYLEEDLIREREELRDELERIRVEREIEMYRNAEKERNIPYMETVGSGSGDES